MEFRDKPEGNFRYLARNGKYYNGYILSSDFSEDIQSNPDFNLPWQQIIDKLEEELKNYNK